MHNNLIDDLFSKLLHWKTFGILKSNSRSAFLLFLFVLSSSMIEAQTIQVTGTVTDGELGGPLVGANILVKGKAKGTTTDFDGNYSLDLDDSSAILIFSYTGFISQEVPVNGKTTIDVVLQPDQEALDEVVIIGYGTSKKSDLTGSVVTIDGGDLTAQPIASAAEALTGRLAGVQVTSTEGSPDAEINIRVRGAGSLTQDSSPLIIVDGFPVPSFSDISPSDIENISVLKDASSTAIYGSRGANGVVIITTKSGKTGKVSVNLNTFYGMKKIANTIDVLEPQDYVKWQYEYALLRDNVQSYEDYFGSYSDYDQYIGMEGNNWQEQIYGRIGKVQSRDLSVRGGSDKINYNFNYAHFDEKAIMVGSDFKRDNLTLSLKSKASDKVDLSFTVRYSDTEINGGGANEQNEVSSADRRLRHSVGYSPIPIPELNSTNTDDAIFGYLVYPFLAVDDNQRRQTRTNFNMIGSFSWDIIENLNFKSDFGLNNRNDVDSRFYGTSTYWSSNRPLVENQGMPGLIIRDRKREDFRNANTLNYDFKKLIKNEDHVLKVLVGEEMIVSKTNSKTSEIHGFPTDFDFETAMNLTTQGDPFSYDNFNSPDDKLLSFFGRLNYDFKNRYLLTATYRMDGSSKFLGSNRWGYFPSAALAWKISEEAFLNDPDWLDILKLRVSYGEVGNNNIPTGQTIQTFESNNTSYINEVSNYWAPSNVQANPNLKWETTIAQNLGLDFGLFNNRVSGSVEVYKNITQDLLIRFPTPGSPYAAQFRNMGELENKGLEASLNIVAIEKEKFNLNLNFNVAMNRNKVTSLGIMDDYAVSTGWASSQIGNDYAVYVGQPIGTMIGYQTDGRYEVSDFSYDAATGEYTLLDGVADSGDALGTAPVPGSMKLKDINGDGVVDTDDIDIIGDANPDLTGGFVLNANAYGFDLSAAFNFSVGNDIYNANKIEFTTSNENSQYRNLSSEMADGVRWTNLDPNTGQLVSDPQQLQALNANTSMWSPYMQRYMFTDWAVEDASFLRLNTLTLGYTIPNTLLKDTGISLLRFYATANNVFVLTNYSGPDPEVSTYRKTPLTPGVDHSAYPRSRQIVFGLNLNF
ncbi:TonB-dependent receptor [Mangrovimonas sp. CR14]|uniref:SusC/RagA family TonB-linked outer membrane protein n=1 Tax=Mangrovimonas sp. CR14 TaxID=2706120 RepID=UPI0014228BE8|nr:TonB-dependent receptor [Mangrovimonas sp. CR14]NIK91549.1 TonB-dependent receptor [Mangrovimonas sp. CR14]